MVQVGPRTRNTHHRYAAIRNHVQQPDLGQVALLGWIVPSRPAYDRKGRSRSPLLSGFVVAELQHDGSLG